MANYDAEVRVSTKVDTSQMQRLQTQIDKAAMKVDALTKKCDELKSQKTPTKEFVDLSGNIEKAKFRVEQLEDALKKAKEVNFNGEWQKLERQEREYNKRVQTVKEELAKPITVRQNGLYEELNSYKVALQNIQNAKQALKAGSYWKREAIDVENAKAELTSLESKMKELEAEGKAFVVTEGNAEALKKANQELHLAKGNLTALVMKWNEVNEKQDESAKSSRKVSDGLKRIGEIGKRAFRGMNAHAKQSSGLFHTMAAKLKGILLSLLIFNWITKAFNNMVSGMKKGFQNLIVYSGEYNKSVSALKSANTQLQNSFAAAFMPIVQAAIPHLITLINYLTTAANAVAQFTAVITGKSSWIKAVAVQEDYASSLNGTAAAAKKAAGALASFDTLEVLNKKDTGGGSSGVNPKDMFEEVPVDADSEVKKWADKVEKAWDNADFFDIGRAIGEWLQNALENIPWDKIQEQARKLGKSIATFINGFVTTVDEDGVSLGTTIGETIGNALNTALYFVQDFVENLDWGAIGRFIGDAINGAIFAFDWTTLGKVVAEGINGIFIMFKNVIDTVDWKQLGMSIVDSFGVFFSTIDWGIIGGSVSSAVVAMFDYLTGIITEIDWFAIPQYIVDSLLEFWKGVDFTEVSQAIAGFLGVCIGGIASFWAGVASAIYNTAMMIIQEFQDNISGSIDDYETMGEFIVQGILTGCLETLKDIGNWAKTNIVDPFVNAVRENFQINSPSKVMEEIGSFVIQGLINGIKGMLAQLTETTRNISSTVIDTFRDVLGIHSPSKETEEIGDYLMQGLSLGMDGNAITAQVQTVCQTIMSTFQTYLNEGSFYQIGIMLLNGIQTAWSEALTWFNGAMTEFWAFFTATYTNYDIWYEQFGNILSAYIDMHDEFQSEWQANTDTWWSTMVMPFFEVAQWQLFGTNMKTGIMQGFKIIVNEMGGVMNKLIVMFDAAFKELEEAMNDLIDSYNASASTLGTSTLSRVHYKPMGGIKIPALANGAVIRGGSPFLAILGDQPHGQTNVETPLATMVDAFNQALDSRGASLEGNLTVNLVVNGERWAQATLDDFIAEANRRGGIDIDLIGGTT
jgi:hypothetical protein